MLCEGHQRSRYVSLIGVLILVLMEDALRVLTIIDNNVFHQSVLILVLMEDALREEAEVAITKAYKS